MYVVYKHAYNMYRLMQSTYIYAYIYIYLCTHKYIIMYFSLCTYIDTYTYMDPYMFASTHTYEFLPPYICIWLHTYIMHAQILMYTDLCICAYINVDVNVYIYTYTHAYIQQVCVSGSFSFCLFPCSIWYYLTNRNIIQWKTRELVKACLLLNNISVFEIIPDAT